MGNFRELPKNLPAPINDGACNHLLWQSLPSIPLFSTENKYVDLSAILTPIVVYCYPMTGKPGIPLPDGWNDIPGARGCTPQSCAFRDHHQELKALGVKVFGLSTQTTEYQIEAVKRLHLSFELLSDANLRFTKQLKLPTFKTEGKQLIKRVTFIVEAGTIIKVFYPVFPPDKNADEVINWLENNIKL